MIEKWFETFMLLEKQTASDNLGGESLSFRDGESFRGALTLVPGEEFPMGGQPVLRENPVLLHEFDLTLAPGDYVRREKDGAVYRVGSSSDSMRSPAFSGLRFAQVDVERVVLP